MSFVIDGSEWRFDGCSNEEIVKAVEELLDRVSIAIDRNETVWIGEDLQTRSVLKALTLWDLYAPSSPVVFLPELWQELAAWLSAAPFYTSDTWPIGLEESLIRIGSDPAEENLDVAWVHHHVRAGREMACLGLKRSGQHETTSKLGHAAVYWVASEESHRAFWRAAIQTGSDDQGRLEQLAPHAFPDLYFFDGVWGGLGRLEGGYLALRENIQRHLAILDDHGKWAFTYPPPALSPAEVNATESRGKPSNQVIEKRFHGLNLDMAPEKPDVHANRVCRNAREIVIGAQTLYCEWHAKLERHRNRLHVHPPTAESNDKLIVAIFDAHLPLPT